MASHDDQRLDAAVRAGARARSATLRGHLSASQLADYSLGLHPPGEEDAIQEHLVLCRECAEAVLDLAAFDEARDERVSDTADFESEREWRLLGDRLDEPPAEAFSRRPAWATAAAAGLAASLVLCAGLLVWIVRLRAEAARAAAPAGDVVIADLFARGSTTERAGAAAARVVVPAGATRAVLLLNLGDLRSFPRYRMSLADGSGRESWADEDVPRGETGAFTLVLPVEDLPDGSYEVHVQGVDGRRREPLGLFLFELVHAGD